MTAAMGPHQQYLIAVRGANDRVAGDLGTKIAAAGFYELNSAVAAFRKVAQCFGKCCTAGGDTFGT